MKHFIIGSALVDPLDISRRDQIEVFIEKFQIIEENWLIVNHPNYPLAGWDMMRHITLEDCMLICAIPIISISAYERKILLSQ